MIADKIFMVRPARFRFNSETAESNAFQQEVEISPERLQDIAQGEFDALVSLMRKHNIEVDVWDDDGNEERPDAIFPNNWLSTHPGHMLVTYPMFSPARRRERNAAFIQHISKRYQVLNHLALEHYESIERYLEGTGSLVIDHEYSLVYANKSPRTDPVPFHRFCQLLGFTPVLFDAADTRGIPVYHTNVVMGIGRGYILINRSAVATEDWPRLEYYFHQSGKTIIEIEEEQMNRFVANVAFLHNREHEPYIVMSESAYQALYSWQKEKLLKFGTLLHTDISTIEKVGGGSVKCMIAENYLDHRKR